MSHQIDMQTGVPAIAYVETEDKPWHGLGTPVFQAMTAQEAIELGRLNWIVEPQPVFTRDGKIIDRSRVIVRLDTQFPLGIVKGKYQIVQNKDAFSMLDSLVEGGLKYHTVGSLFDGRKIWLLAKLPGQIQVIGQDVVDKFLLLSTSHDGSQTLRIMFTPIRVVCNNTLTTAQNELGANYLLNAKHTHNITKKIVAIKDFFVDINRRSKEFQDASKAMVCKTLNDEQIEAFLFDVLGYSKTIKATVEGKVIYNYLDGNDADLVPTRTVNVVERIKELHEVGPGANLPGVKGTIWGAYNAVTNYADFHSVVKHNSEEARLNSAFFGNMATLKDRAFTKAMQLVTT